MTAASSVVSQLRQEQSSSADRLNVLQRLNAVQKKVSYIQKEKKAGMNYSITSHDAVTALVRPHLVEQGVLYYPISMDHNINGNRTEVVLTTRFVSVDDPEDYIDVVSAGYGVDPSDKGAGKAISYGIKYALLKALGLETGDDPDLDQDSVHTTATRSDVSGIAELILSASDMARDAKELDRFYLENTKLFETLKAGDKGGYESVMRQMRVTKLALQEKESHANREALQPSG